VDAVARLTAPFTGALRVPWVGLTLGVLLAAAAALAAPSNDLLPKPEGVGQTLLAVTFLAGVFALGYLRPLYGFYGLVGLVVLEGAVRKWLVNDISVFLGKDFLALGVYTAVLPRLRWQDLRRPWWLVAPLGLLAVLALGEAVRVGSISQATIGLRAYLLYVPLFWVGPALLTTRARVYALTGVILGLAALNAVFAVVQALAGPGILNKLVSGALAGLITVNGSSYIRPSGSFMQVGVLAMFLFFGTLVAFALLVAERRGRWLYLAFGGFALIAWGVVYSSARSSLGSLMLAYVLLTLALLWRRRFLTVAAVPAVFALSLVVLFVAVPWVKQEGAAIMHAIQRDSWKWVAIPQAPLAQAPTTGSPSAGTPSEEPKPEPARPALRVRVPPETAQGLAERIRTTKTDFAIEGVDANGDALIVAIAPREGAVTTSRPVKSVLGVDEKGQAIRVQVGQPTSATAGGFLGRAADFNTAGGEVGLWGSRIQPQFSNIAGQGLFGNGTGTMTLGSGYADNKPTVLFGEGMYVKLAWELGWVGLALFVWLVGALIVATVDGARRAQAWRQVPALVGAGAALILPIWYVFTFAADYPVAAILFWTFAGCAVAYGSSAAIRAPIADHER
jgi:hypothetical protein